MSHFTKISTEIRDREALIAAAQSMGFPVETNANCRYYYGTQKKELVIKLPGRYDIGFKHEYGQFNIEADFYGGHVAQYIGQNGERLMQQYACEKVKIEAFQKGLAVTEKSEGNQILVTLIDQDTGGQILVTCKLGGVVEFKTTGFQGEGCMKFQDLEQSLGQLNSLEYTTDFYLENRRVENVSHFVEEE